MTSRSAKHRNSQREYNASLAEFFSHQALTYNTIEVLDRDHEFIAPDSLDVNQFFHNDYSYDMEDINPVLDMSDEAYEERSEDISFNESFDDFSEFLNDTTSVTEEPTEASATDFECQGNADCSKPNSLDEDLFIFVMLFNLSNGAIQFLLTTLLKHGVSVPKSVHLLKSQHSKSSYDSWLCGAGKIAYYSIKSCFKFLINNKFLKSDTYVDMQVNIDGLPLYRSSPLSLWPILIKLERSIYSKPFPVGFYLGRYKPDVESFLGKFVGELKEVLKDGYLYNGIRVIINNIVFICDAPARAMVQGIKSFSGYNGCGYCREVGEYCDRRVVFPGVSAEPREDLIYLSMEENNQISSSIVRGVVPLKSAFPAEYLHLICLGIMRKLLHYYCGQSKGPRLPCRLSANQMETLSCNLVSISKYLPVEFHRKIRSLKNIAYFKGSEFRTLLLYIVPVTFKPFLPTRYYNHLILLHFITYCLCSDKCNQFIEMTRTLTKIFIQQTENLFGRQSLIYNIHCLLHLPDFVEKYGCLDNFSAFPFENFLYHIKRKIKATRYIFEHIASAISIMPSLLGKGAAHSLTFTTEIPNNCAITGDGNIIIVSAIRKMNLDWIADGTVLKFSHDLYDYPYQSSKIAIGIYSLSNVRVHNVKLVNKGICIPHRNQFIVIPFANSHFYL